LVVAQEWQSEKCSVKYAVAVDKKKFLFAHSFTFVGVGVLFCGCY